MTKNIFISCDHGGFYLKEQIFEYLLKKSFKIIDLGTKDPSSVDYPDYSNVLVDKIKNNLDSMGILLCGTGIGMSISANRHSHIRAALCTDEEMARLSRQHNDANVIALPARFVSEKELLEMIEVFLDTDFEGGRHERRVGKIACC